MIGWKGPDTGLDLECSGSLRGPTSAYLSVQKVVGNWASKLSSQKEVSDTERAVDAEQDRRSGPLQRAQWIAEQDRRNGPLHRRENDDEDGIHWRYPWLCSGIARSSKLV